VTAQQRDRFPEHQVADATNERARLLLLMIVAGIVVVVLMMVVVLLL
jgi:hypothetical protein